VNEDQESDQQEHEALDADSDFEPLRYISHYLISKVRYLDEANNAHKSKDSIDLADAGEPSCLADHSLVKDLVERNHG
jgi:hypothetical protein